MFKFKKKTQLVHCEELISLKPLEGTNFTNIIVKDKPFNEYIQDLLISLKIYDDALYIELYKEYIKDFTVYDLVPSLLYFKINPLFKKAYPEENIPDIFLLSIVEKFYEKLPSIFKLTKTHLEIVTVYSKIKGFLSSEAPSVEYFEKVIKYQYVSMWDSIQEDTVKYVRLFLNGCMEIILKYIIPDNHNIVVNMINRHFKDVVQNSKEE